MIKLEALGAEVYPYDMEQHILQSCVAGVFIYVTHRDDVSYR